MEGPDDIMQHFEEDEKALFSIQSKYRPKKQMGDHIDILTVFVNLPTYDELSFLRSNNGVAERFCLARPARKGI
jgi:hypothetical protein